MNYVASGYVRSGRFRQDSDTVGDYTFDKYGKFIFVSENVTSIDLAEMYSRWVDWLVVDDNMKIKPAMKYSGFDVIPGGFTGATFFVQNGWRVVYNTATTAITGVLYSSDYDTGYWDNEYNPIYPVTVSAVVNTVSVGSGLSAAQNEKLMSLINADFTNTDVAIAGIKTDTETMIDDIAAISAGSGATAQEVWEYANRELTSMPTSGLNESELHTALDAYSNKSLWKADLSPLIAGVNVTKVAGSSVTGVNDFKAAAADLSSVESAIASVKADTGILKVGVAGLENYDDTEVQGKLDSIEAKDSFGAGDRDELGRIGTVVDEIVTGIDDSEVAVKAHVTSKTSTLATSAEVASVASAVSSSRAAIDSILASMDSLDEADANSIYAKLVAIKADIASVQSSTDNIPEDVWGKVV